MLGNIFFSLYNKHVNEECRFLGLIQLLGQLNLNFKLFTYTSCCSVTFPRAGIESPTRGLFRTLLSCFYPVICKVWSLIHRNAVCESDNIFSLSSALIIVENPELIHWYSLSQNCLLCTLLNLSVPLLKWIVQVRRLKYCLRQPVPLCS